MDEEKGLLVEAADLNAHFHKQVQLAVINQNLQISSHTEFYLVRMLSDFCHVEALMLDGSKEEKPLAILYLESLTQSPRKGIQTLRHLGDLSLYISGFFQDSLNRKLINLDYYIAMGGNAYHHLYGLTQDRGPASSLSETFLELANRFIEFVDVLSEVSEKSCLTNNSDLLRLYEKWLHTGSTRLEKRLQDFGIHPDASFKCDIPH